jgi:hypothetical protein
MHGGRTGQYSLKAITGLRVMLTQTVALPLMSSTGRSPTPRHESNLRGTALKCSTKYFANVTANKLP